MEAWDFFSQGAGRKVAAVLTILCLLLGACARGGRDLPDVALDLIVDPWSPRIGPATVTLTLADAKSQPIRGARVEPEGNMHHAGMVPVLAQAGEVSPGQYQAEPWNSPWGATGSSWSAPTCPTGGPWNAAWTCLRWTQSAAIRPCPERSGDAILGTELRATNLEVSRGLVTNHRPRLGLT